MKLKQIALLGRSLIFVLILPIFSFSQEKPKDIKSSTDIVNPAIIVIPDNLQSILKLVDLELENAKLKSANLDLQLRLMLKVPNDYIRVGNGYEKPKSENEKVDKKDDKKDD